MSTRDRTKPCFSRGASGALDRSTRLNHFMHFMHFMSRAGLVVLVALTGTTFSGVASASAPLRLMPARAGMPLRALPLRTLPVRAAFDAREDLKAAYNKALGQYNNLEFDGAKSTLESALSGAAADDPATAPLRMLKGATIFSNTGKSDDTTAAFIDAVKADYNVALPTELRSPDLQKLLEKARKSSGASAPSESVQHTAPAVDEACGKDIVFSALAAQVPDGGQVAFYWRQVGGGEFKTATMDTFGNLATVTLTASDHGDKPVEYFFYVFDSANKELGNRGDQESPLKLDLVCQKEVVEKPKVVEEAPKPKTTLPRVFINLGLGTGAGIARGVADQSYKQLSPVDGYTPADYACSIARWQAGSQGVPNAVGFANGLNSLSPAQYGPYSAAELSLAYNEKSCGEHHPVKSGMASAPFHIAPEIGFRIGRALVLSVFGRLQLVTGSKVYRDDPTLDLNTSFNEEVRSPAPEGVRTKPGFTAAGGLKVKYFLGKDDKKFRLFIGGVVGGGFARLRVPMGFANDRNGNSVPDDREVAAVSLGQCQPVWPYAGACGGASQANDTALAGSVALGADKTQRVDTVRVGGGFIGVTFGFNYQVAKHFALFAEIQPTVWFPKTTSFMIDFAFGPVITF